MKTELLGLCDRPRLTPPFMAEYEPELTTTALAMTLESIFLHELIYFFSKRFLPVMFFLIINFVGTIFSLFIQCVDSPFMSCNAFAIVMSALSPNKQ